MEAAGVCGLIWDRRRMAAAFVEFAGHEAVQLSPLYVHLARYIADDADLLDLAAAGPPDQPPPNLLLAAVQDLLLGGTVHPLSLWYRSVDRAAASVGDGGDPIDALRDFCDIHRDAILDRLRHRRVQTNEVGRVALLLPGLQRIAAQVARPLATIELGASAGLNLLWPWIEVDYGDQRTGPLAPDLRLRCSSRGARLPLSRRPPCAGLRLGVDSHPLDIGDDATLRWLDALIWPEDDERRHRLRQGARAACKHRVSVQRADLRDGLQALLDAVPDDQQPVFVHTAVMYQLTPGERDALDAELTRLGRQRPLHRLSMEWVGTSQTELRLGVYTESGVDHSVLAIVNAHGHWIQWLDAAGSTGA